ncbi:MAG: hypothetical protein IGR93_07250 [Hydrococcus sp. C42_A2020_068]|nr:hypothetical protein [Hydrococcus sp. C42_A2020_068]
MLQASCSTVFYYTKVSHFLLSRILFNLKDIGWKTPMLWNGCIHHQTQSGLEAVLA